MLIRARVVVVILSCLALAAAALVGDALRRGEDALIQRRYAEAATALDQALAEAKPEERERVLLLLGRARGLAGDGAGAIEAYRTLLREHPVADSRAKARFRLADTLAGNREQGEAATIYRQEVERLIGDARKEEVAATYLGLAEKAMKTEKPDWKRAVTLLDLALDLGLTPEKARSVRLLAGEARLNDDNAKDAIARLEPLVKDLDLAAGKLRAMLLLGRARAAAGDRAGARTVFADLIAAAKTSEEAAEAAYQSTLTFGVPKPAANDLDRAIAALGAFARDYPAHPKARVAVYLVGECLKHAGRSDAALVEFRRFVELRGGDPIAEVAVARATIGDVLAGQGKLQDAVKAWQDYLQAHPAHQDWERVQRAIVDAEWGMAAAAYQRGVDGEVAAFAEARTRFDTFLAAYPLDERNPQALRLLGEMLLREKKFTEAVTALERCVSKYPGKEEAGHAQFQIGEIYETDLFSYLDALRAYRKVTWSRFQAQAQQRIGRLERKHLALMTPRTYRTGEAATFKVTSRNIPKLRVRVFRLDLETYFRATHAASAIEGLDIEVIEADKTFESGILDYKQYRETEREVDVGFQEAGAYVVKVDDSELEATTMVLVTDLALIAKTSRHELFVLTQNVKENRVEGGVKVVVSDGSRVVSEGVTGADGTWRYKGECLKNTDQLRVFAVAASGSGAGSLDLSGMGYSTGLQPVGYVFTDRPAYQPGQAVHIKGIVREVREGLYRLPEQKDYRVQVFSAGGRLVLQRDVEFTAFGTFAVDLNLPPEADLGDWRIAVTRTGGEAFPGTFTVARYERPRLTLAGSADAPVVYRGEAIKGRFILRYFFGEPAAGKLVRYALQLPDGVLVQREATTNALGEVPFEFDTKEFAEEGMALITAALPEENIGTRLIVPIATTEFEPVLTMARDVYLAGEAFTAKVKLLDRAGKPVQRQGEAVLLRLERKRGANAQVEVARVAFTTSGADGVADVRFTASLGGTHVVRVEAKDRFGVVVTAEAQVVISGDDDTVKLRLLADRDTFKVGEEIALRVVNRAGPRLVLETVQGDGVLAYRTYVLPAGTSNQRVKLQALHAPNFALALAMIDGTRLFVAERPFEVERDLSITVKAQATALPGSTLPVELEARDAEGNPVAAEIALAVVDEALLAVHPDGTAKLRDAFWGRRRETAFKTTSSCDWSYRGAARGMSAELVAEERRAEREALAGLPVLQDSGVQEEAEGAFASNAWNSAVGVGGGAGGRAGGRQAQGRGQVRALQAGRPASQTAQLDELTGSDEFFLGGVRRFAAEDQQEQLAYFAKNAWGGDRLALHREVELALDRPRADFSETGGWLSAVVTGADGKARVELPLPDSTTAWRLHARAVTAATDVGEGTTEVRTSKPMQVSLVGPAVLTQGDKTTLSARVHNLGDDARNVRVVATAGTKAFPARDLAVPAHGELGADLPFTAEQVEDLELRLMAAGGDLSDEVVQRLFVQPFGRELRTGRSGSTSEAERFALTLPAGEKYLHRRLTLTLGPDLGRDLLAAALGLGFEPFSCRRVDNTNYALASRGLSALLVLDWLERSGGATPADITRLRGQAQASLGRLLALQRQDGSYAWIKQSDGDLRTTSQVVSFASLAARRGLTGAEDLVNKASEWLLQQMRRSKDRARPMLALALAGRAQFEDLNALHRERASLGVDALARLALAWHHAKRATLATEIGELLKAKISLHANPDASQLEATALAAAALLVIDPKDAVAARTVAWLEGQRVGVSFGTPEATAAALWALTLAGGRGAATASEGEIGVTVNGRALAQVPAASRSDRSTFEVPTDWLVDGKNEIGIAVRGRARVHYQATLIGFAEGFPAARHNRELVRIDRKYLAPARRHDGKLVPAGFSVVTGTYSSFENRVTSLEAGSSARVQTTFWVRDEAMRGVMTPLVVEEPIPAGCSVSRESVRGNFDHFEIEPDRLTFYFREGNTSATVEYELQARFPGEYRVLPTRVYGALRPDLLVQGTPGALAIRAVGQGENDAYRETPDELFHIGKALFEAGDLAGAGVRLDRLLTDWHQEKVQVRDHVFKEVARMLLFVAIARHDAAATVRYFEVLKDRYADLVIPFEKIVAIGQAYIDLGEFERALMVFRAAAEASFLKDAAVATTLEQMGEIDAATRFLHRLIDVYPDLNLIRSSLYSVAQKQADLAARLLPDAPIDAKVGSAKTLRAGALASFREFLVHYPDDPLAEEVSFAWANTHIEGRDLEAALAVSDAALARYPGSVLTDEFLYTAGYAHFALGRPEPAFAILRRVADETFPRPDGSKGPSENRDHAVYLQGQIHHALGQPAEALAAYERVKNLFSDAAEATDYFLRKRLSLPEVTTLGEKDAPKVEVSYRNVERATVKVYRVDLMRLYLLEKSLNDIRGVQLHGIRPYAELTLELGNGRDYRLQTKPLELKLTEPGAYLVVLSGGDLLASGMVLRSDLRIEAQESLDVGRIRVNVKANDAVVADAHVKVIGAGDQRFRSGDSDLRGIFVADELVGEATVIVKKGDQYAFYRGSGVHQPARFKPAPVQTITAPDPSNNGQYKNFDAMSNNRALNFDQRGKQIRWLQDNVLQKQQQGVEVYRTK